MKIGIIGNGFVGNALANGFGLFCDVLIHDKDPGKTANSIHETVNSSHIVFVCVPTPMKTSEMGRVDLSIIKDVLNELRDHLNESHDPLIVIKSSVPPGSVESFIEEYKTLRIVFNPEFLTERNANLDFLNATRIVIGGDPVNCQQLHDLYRERFPYKHIITTDVTTAQFIKYMANCFFSVKISFMNEMLEIAEKLNVDWEKAREGFVTDGRVGNSHLDVPGHDGSRGFGGKCFPKDINAFINIAKENGIDPKVLEAAWNKNIEVRANQDWKNIPGATSE